LYGVRPGVHSYTAKYLGDSVYAPSTSVPLSVTVPPRPPLIATVTTFAIATPPDPFTGNLDIGALIDVCKPSGAPDLTGTVQFFDGATLLVGASINGQESGAPPCGSGSPVRYRAGFGLATYLHGVSPGVHSYTPQYLSDSVS